MSQTGDVLNQVIPALVRLARRPGAWLLRFAAIPVGTFLVLALVHGLTGSSFGDWVPALVAVLVAAPLVTLAVRRHRLQVQVGQVDDAAARTISGDTRALARRDDAGSPLDDERETLSAAMAENALLTARFLPRVEAAQRAARVAAGGTVQAPYLKDDIRITLLALLGTILALPLGSLGAIVTAILLLTR